MALPLAEELLACLCTALDDSPAGPPCICCLSPGPEPMECNTGPEGEGVGWVRVVRIFPTAARFPIPATDPQRCLTGAYAVELELGVYRCVSVVDDQGDPPTCAQRTADAEKLLGDAAALRRAVCCFTQQGRQMIVGEWRPLGPSGGCAGGAMTVTVEAADCCP